VGFSGYGFVFEDFATFCNIYQRLPITPAAFNLFHLSNNKQEEQEEEVDRWNRFPFLS